MTTRYIFHLFVVRVIMTMVMLLLAIPYNLKFELLIIRQRTRGFYWSIVGWLELTVFPITPRTIYQTKAIIFDPAETSQKSREVKPPFKDWLALNAVNRTLDGACLANQISCLLDSWAVDYAKSHYLASSHALKFHGLKLLLIEYSKFRLLIWWKISIVIL